MREERELEGVDDEPGGGLGTKEEERARAEEGEEPDGGAHGGVGGGL